VVRIIIPLNGCWNLHSQVFSISDFSNLAIIAGWVFKKLEIHYKYWLLAS
jgi:hypothetical protein